MTARIVAGVAVIVAVLAGPAWSVPDDPSGTEAITKVFKYAGTKEASSGGKSMMMLCVASKFGKDVPAVSGAPAEIAIPNNDPNGAKMDPASAVMDVIKDVKAGGFIRAQYKKVQERYVLERVEKCTPKSVEIDPEAYEFVKVTSVKASGGDAPAILVKRADKEQTLLIQSKKNDQGAMVPDEEILTQTGKFKAGDYADIDLTQAGGAAQVKGIRAYEPPAAAVFVKMGSEKGEGGATLMTIELKKDDQSVVLYIRPAREAGPADAAMIAKAKTLKAKQAVLYKSVTAGGKQWLKDIKAEDAAEITLTGSCVWKGSKPTKAPNPLKAVLTPSGPNEWKAVYYFPWGNSNKVWTGTVKGDLKNGAVSGDTSGENGRTFSFSGSAKDGVLTFDCTETTRGKTEHQATGTL